jgi:hypothetical protein
MGRSTDGGDLLPPYTGYITYPVQPEQCRKEKSPMFAYVLRAPGTPPSDQTDDFFRRFSQTPGLVHAFDLQGREDPGEGLVVAIWESREAAEHYLNQAPLRREVDSKVPQVTRTLYDVRASK